MDNQVVRIVDSLADNVGTPRALAVKMLVRAGEWVQLQQLKCRPSDYRDAESYFRDCMITDLLRKCDLPSSLDREAAARSTFLLCEKENHRTNARLRRFLPEHLFLEVNDMPVYDFISRWRKNVYQLMGNLPDHLTPRFSGGATYADTGHYITTPDKMSSTPTMYQETGCLLPFWQETSWFRALSSRPRSSTPTTVRGNIFFTVPKDGTKFRGCCKEASINVSFQLDVGRVLKSKLKRIGIDLQEGQNLHRELARESSVSGDLATIDMSNASDTVCRVLVQLLLRGDWYELLNSLRATHTRVDGSWHRLEKFSSMGNGFTFELETIIFATLARTVIASEGGDPDLVRCYGDDLIVPSAHYLSVVSALRMFGFTPNMEKTFAEGPFRESCGGDFFDGVPVRAHFIKELPDEPQKWIALANGLRRMAGADVQHSPRWSMLRTAWLRALDCIPTHIRRCRGPQSLGDVVIHDDESEWCWSDPPRIRDSSQRTDPMCGWETSRTWIRTYQPVPSVLPWHHWIPDVQLASCTLGYTSTGVSPRGGVSGYRMGRTIARPHSTWQPRPMNYGS